MFELGQEAIESYLARRRQDAVEIAHAREARDWNVIERIGHQIKGNGAMFGYPELSCVGKGLEDSARAHDPVGVQQYLIELKNWLTIH